MRTHKTLLASLFVALAASAPAAHAEVIFEQDFDSATPPTVPVGGWPGWTSGSSAGDLAEIDIATQAGVGVGGTNALVYEADLAPAEQWFSIQWRHAFDPGDAFQTNTPDDLVLSLDAAFDAANDLQTGEIILILGAFDVPGNTEIMSASVTVDVTEGNGFNQIQVSLVDFVSAGLDLSVIETWYVHITANSNLNYTFGGEDDQYSWRFDNVSIDVIPEPASVMLVGSGLVCLLSRGGRRSTASVI